MEEQREILNTKQKVDIKEAFIGDKITIEVQGPTGKLNIQKEYLDEYGYTIKKSKDSDSYVDREEKTVRLSTKHSSVFEIDNKILTLITALHEVGHIENDSEGKDVHFANKHVDDVEKGNEVDEPSAFSYARTFNMNETGADIQMLHLLQDINEKTGFNITREISFEDFYLPIEFRNATYRKYGDRIIDASTNQEEIQKTEDQLSGKVNKEILKELWDNI